MAPYSSLESTGVSSATSASAANCLVLFSKCTGRRCLPYDAYVACRAHPDSGVPGRVRARSGYDDRARHRLAVWAAIVRVGTLAVIAFVRAGLIARFRGGVSSVRVGLRGERRRPLLYSRTVERHRLEYAVGTSLFLGDRGTTAFNLATTDEWFFEFIVTVAIKYALVVVTTVNAPAPSR